MKFFEVPVIGDGTAENPYRPDVPAGVSYSASDGQVMGGVGAAGGQSTGLFSPDGVEGFTGRAGGKMLIGIKNSVNDFDITSRGGTKVRTYDQLTAAEKAKVDDYRTERGKPESPGRAAAMQTALNAMPADAAERVSAKFKLTAADLETWSVS